jgi:DNA-binding NarL/FixJ family response regulator
MTLSPEPPVRVVLCDDHRVLSDALATLIGMDEGLVLVAAPVQTGQDAIDAVEQYRPDVVLMDVELIGVMDGFEATRHIKEISPQTNVVVMSGVADPDSALIKAIEAGASGFLPKTEAADRMLDGVRAAARGESLIDAATLARVLRRIAQNRKDHRGIRERTSRLTDREREVLQNLARGHSNDDIAAALFISPHTVQTHTRNILGKLDVHSKLQAVALAAQAGLLTATDRQPPVPPT